MQPGNGFAMNPAAVKAGGGQLAPLVNQLNELKANTESALNAQGACWGGDEAGTEFAKGYQPGATMAIQAIHTLAEAIAAMAKNVETAANSHQAGDAGAAKGIASQQV